MTIGHQIDQPITLEKKEKTRKMLQLQVLIKKEEIK